MTVMKRQKRIWISWMKGTTWVLEGRYSCSHWVMFENTFEKPSYSGSRFIFPRITFSSR